MPDTPVPSHLVAVDVPTYRADTGLTGWWNNDESVTLRSAPNEIVIVANAAGLEALARDLLALAQEGVPQGTESYRMALGHAPTLTAGSPALRLVRG
jgi:hypothetical protein